MSAAVQRSSLRLTPLGGAIVGAWFGAMLPAVAIGIAISLAQMDAYPRWLAFASGVVVGPLVLVGEMIDAVGGNFAALRILPWALPAAIGGAWVGRRLARRAPRAA